MCYPCLFLSPSLLLWVFTAPPFTCIAIAWVLLPLVSLARARLGLLIPLLPGPLNSPIMLFFPILVLFPALPVLLNLVVGNPLVLPRISSPIMVFVALPPPWGNLLIKGRGIGIIGPILVIAARTVPAAVPWPIPPAVMEEDVFFCVRHSVDIGLGKHDR